MSEWHPFAAAVEDVTGGNTKIQLRDYLEAGCLPVIDQGKTFIGGYTNNQNLAYSGPSPCVIFGDHTKILKYVDIPFALGADGVKVLVPRSKHLNAKFLYHYLRLCNLPDAGYSRHFKFLKELKVPIPPLDEQRRIVELLDRAAEIRRHADAARSKARALIPALFLDMFGDPATNPKKWPERRLGEVASVGSGAGFPKADQGQQGQQFPFLKVSDMNLPGNEVAIVAWNNTVSDEVRRRLNAKAFAAGSIIFPKIGAAIATNKKRILTVPSCVDNNVMAVTFESYLNATFGLWLFQSKNISDFASASEPPSMRKTSVEDWAIPVPPFVLQTAFAEQAQRLQGTARSLDAAAMKAEAMAAGLSAEVFKTGSGAAWCDAA